MPNRTWAHWILRTYRCLYATRWIVTPLVLPLLCTLGAILCLAVPTLAYCYWFVWVEVVR